LDFLRRQRFCFTDFPAAGGSGKTLLARGAAEFICSGSRDDVTKWPRAETAAVAKNTGSRCSHPMVIPTRENIAPDNVIGAMNMPWNIDHAFL
jgi:hypothetical protein